MHSRTLIATCILAVIVCLGNARAWGQMLVYAMTGTIRSVTTTELIATSDGQTQSFVVEPKSHPSFSFDKELREDSTPIGDFHKSDTFAVIYFYGVQGNRTAVAVKDLGAGPFARTTGTVTHFDRHTRRLTIQTTDGKTEDLIVGEKAVVDSGESVEPGRKADPSNGSTVRATSVQENDAQTIVFLRLRRPGE
jgi:hypothetical protein